jgi:hypothetical protein
MTTHDDRWPKPLGEAAFYGPLGDIVTALAPQTEADPAAILGQLLVMFGNCIGRTPHFRVGADEHHVNLNCVVVGRTSDARKGMARAQAQHVFNEVDPDWSQECVKSGLSSGEGLIHHVRDPISRKEPIKEKGRVVRYEEIIADHGVDDKRVCVVESEFASTLRVMARDGNILSAVIRQAWDGLPLRVLTKTSPEQSTGAHISIIGHITADELRRALNATEYANGFANRILWLLSKRSKILPHGGERVSLAASAAGLRRAVDAARRATELQRDDAANRHWERIYGRLSAGRPGLLGAVTARAEAQVMRLACLYALADASAVVTVDHLTAALAFWRYCFESARWLFGGRVGDRIADAILSELRRLWPERMKRTEISNLFGRNQSAAVITAALERLQEYRLVSVDEDRDGEGRPIHWWGYDKDGESLDYDINEITTRTTGKGGVNSFISSPAAVVQVNAEPVVRYRYGKAGMTQPI